MTSTVTGQCVPDPATVLKRVDDRLARDAGDDPLPAETLAVFAAAVQEQIVAPLLGGATAGPDLAAAAELEHKDDVIAELRRMVEGHTKSYEQAVAEKRRVMEAADRDRDKLRAEVTKAEDESERYCRVANNYLAKMNELQEALDERSSVDVERHRHFYPAERPGAIPSDCECGHPYPRAHITDRSHEPASAPDAWAGLFAGLRVQLADWKPGRTTR